MENRYSFTPLDFLYRYRYALVILSAAFLLIVALVVLLLRQRLQSVEAKADARAKSRFLSTMSHEVRTPLNGLIGLNYLMAHKLHDEEQLARYLHQSTTTANYLLALVSDILDMSMLHNGDFKIEHKPMDLRLLLSTVETIVQNGMKEKNILFQTDISLPYANIIGDEVRIQQILLNLLDNAKKFTPEGGKVTVSACQTLEESGKIHTEIHVSDTGKGMSKAFQDNIFDAFAQERDTVSKGDEGVGLGLSICHRLAKLMDGDISFVSQPNKGSTFTFFFPAEPADTPAAEKATAFVPPQDKPCILIAEDNELNGEIMLELLSENEYDAKLAVNGREALDLFSSSEYGTYGVILMDLLMPEMDGFEATAAIRALDRPDAKTVKILACSANCTVEDQKKAFACGMDDFLAKPIDIDVLLGKLTV